MKGMEEIQQTLNIIMDQKTILNSTLPEDLKNKFKTKREETIKSLKEHVMSAPDDKFLEALVSAERAYRNFESHWLITMLERAAKMLEN